MSGNNFFFFWFMFLFPCHDYHFSVNIDLYTTRIQSYVAVLKMKQKTKQNDDQNGIESPENIPMFNNIFTILKSPFVENENGALWCIIWRC